MNNLIKRIQNQQIRDFTYMYSKDNNIPEDEIILSLAYLFAHNLPYSMDIRQKEYVPADFMNMTPYDVSNHKTFWEDYQNVYDGMINFGETFSSGLLIQVCSIFQKMLSGQFPDNYTLEESDFYAWEIDKMTDDKEYNEKFFEILKSLPENYRKVQNAQNDDDRRTALNDVYMQIKQSIGNRVGGFKETNANGDVVEEVKPTIMLCPSLDLDMLYESYHITPNSRNVFDLRRILIEKELKAKSLKENDTEKKQIDAR